MKTENIIIRLSEIDKQKIKEQAEARQMTMSEYILYLARMDSNKN